MVAGKAEILLVGTAVEHTLSLHRTGHEAMSLGRHLVSHIILQVVERVEHVPSLRVVNLEMQMRSLRRTCVPAGGYHLSFGHRAIGSLQPHIGRIALMLILPALHGSSYLRRESLQMTIDAGIASRVLHIDSIAKTIKADGHARDVTIGY